MQYEANEIDWADIGKRVKEKRILAGLTQEQLAIRAGLETPTINRIENNRSNIKLDSLIKIANALEASADELLCGSLISGAELYQGEIMEQLKDCTTAELDFIKNMVSCLLEQLRKQSKKE